MSNDNQFLKPGIADEIQAEIKKREPGRPQVYTQDMAGEILLRIAQGEPLSRICRDEHLPNRCTIYEWIWKDTDGFTNKYAQAKELGAEAIRDEMFDIVDDGRNDWLIKENKNGDEYKTVNKEAIMRSKLRADHRQWYLSVFKPKVYGTKQSVELTGKDGGPVHMKSEVKADKIAELLSTAKARKAQTSSEQDSDFGDLV